MSRRLSWVWGALSGFVLLLGCDGPPDRVHLPDEPTPFEPSEPAAQPDPDLAFAATMEDALAKRWTTEFPIGSTRDVIVAIRLPAATTTDQVRFIRLDVNLADGTPYEMTRRAFSQNATSSVQVEHPQLLRPMQAFPVQGDRIYMTLAVAGTRITQHQLGGRFDLAVTLENDTGDAPPYLAGSVEVLR